MLITKSVCLAGVFFGHLVWWPYPFGESPVGFFCLKSGPARIEPWAGQSADLIRGLVHYVLWGSGDRGPGVLEPSILGIGNGRWLLKTLGN